MTAGLLGGTYVGLGIVGLWVLGGVVMDVLGGPNALPQLISHAWHSRPWRALSRERRTRPQGPGN